MKKSELTKLIKECHRELLKEANMSKTDATYLQTQIDGLQFECNKAKSGAFDPSYIIEKTKKINDLMKDY